MPAVWCSNCFERKQEYARVHITCPDCLFTFRGKGEFNRHKKLGRCEKRLDRLTKPLPPKVARNIIKSKGKRQAAKIMAKEPKMCAICQFDAIVHCHHIDKDRNNHRKTNLIYLCPNHHYMVHYGLLSLQNEKATN